MDKCERRTRIARLRVASPDRVYDELRQYATEVKASPYGASSDELESLLLERGDPLIDLGLASFGSNGAVVGELYRRAVGEESDKGKAQQARGLRLAVLSNETVGAKGLLSRFPESVIGEAELKRVLQSAEWAEAEALVLNPRVSDSVLLAIYRGDGPVIGIDETRRRELVTFSARNPRVGTNEDDEFGPDMGHWGLHKAIFQMVGTVPTSDRWASTLTYFLRELDPAQVHRPDSLDVVLDRWGRDESGGLQDLEVGDEYTSTGLSQRQELRCLIGALYGVSYRKGTIVHGSPDDEDIARRCAFYGNAGLDVKAMQAGFERDEACFTFAAMFNNDVFLNRKTRRHFEEECLRGSDAALYEERCKQLHKSRKWFDPRPTAEWMVEEDGEKVQYATERQVAQLEVSVAEIQKLSSYVLWLIIAIAALVVWKV